MSVRYFPQGNWPSIAIAVTVFAIAIAAVVLLSNMPPHVIVMATGPEGGTYYELGKRYRAILARDGVEVRLVPTTGSVQNLALLRDPRSGVNVTLMQGGIGDAGAASGVESLGTVFYEPLWLFHRRDLQIEGTDVANLRGRKISIGPEGSGTRALALELLHRAGIDEKNNELLPLSPRDTAEKLLAGQIDIALLTAAWTSPVVQQLLTDERVAISNYPRADALVALFPFLHKLVLPRGVANLVKDLPPSDVVLVASKASLVVRDDMHPAIQYLLLNAATEIHSRASIFNRANEFPAAESVDFPLSGEAVRFYKSGLPILHEYFPFWMAELLGKLIILLIPIVGVLYPMIYIFPRVYDWAMRSKVLRLYGELRLLENATARGGYSGSNRIEMIAELDRLEMQVNELKIPVTYAGMLYELRSHINLVRESLKKRAENVLENSER